MRTTKVWAQLLGIDHAVIEVVTFDEEEQLLIAQVRPSRTRAGRCGVCSKRCPGYDQGSGKRRWRTLDLGSVRAVVEADSTRVRCTVHGVVVAGVPWARHGAGHTRTFDDMVAWLAVACSKTAVKELMRIAWRTVGAIITRVIADLDATIDRLAGVSRIGIDEISYKRGHRYLTVVVDHDSRKLIWAAAGRDRATLETFFDALGPDRSAQITHVTADAAAWIAAAVAARAPNAVLCADAFHVVAWATDALDEVRRQAWNDARKLAATETKARASQGAADADGRPGHTRAVALKGARYALWKNPEDLTDTQVDKLAWIAKTDPRLHRAYLLKEGLRHVFAAKGAEGIEALDRWLSWARRCQIPPFVKLAKTVAKRRASIEASLTHNMSNALVESTNTKIRVLTRVAFGFKSPEALIALAMLSLGGYRPALPGR